jgi:hypothetical protein
MLTPTLAMITSPDLPCSIQAVGTRLVLQAAMIRSYGALESVPDLEQGAMIALCRTSSRIVRRRSSSTGVAGTR